jgi:hypothetical protein
VPSGERQQAIQYAVDNRDIEGVREHERQEYGAGRCAHGGKVTEIDGECAVPDRVWRHKPAIEVHAFDLRVGREDVERATFGRNDRRVVAGADDNPVRHGQATGNTRHECALAKLRDRARGKQSGCGHQSTAGDV